MRTAWTREMTVLMCLLSLAQIMPLAHTTVMTIMGRLADKGLLAIEKQGKTWAHYRAAQTPEAFKAQAGLSRPIAAQRFWWSACD